MKIALPTPVLQFQSTQLVVVRVSRMGSRVDFHFLFRRLRNTVLAFSIILASSSPFAIVAFAFGAWRRNPVQRVSPRKNHLRSRIRNRRPLLAFRFPLGSTTLRAV